MPEYEVVYWELNRISRRVKAKSVELAIAKSERLRRTRVWDDCEEETEGTNGVEQVYLADKLVYNSGTIAGMDHIDFPPGPWEAK